MQPKAKQIFFALLLFITGACTETKTKQDDRPNIILIVSDDHGTDAVGAYGNPVIQTPGIDQLAREGIRFDRAQPRRYRLARAHLAA